MIIFRLLCFEFILFFCIFLCVAMPVCVCTFVFVCRLCFDEFGVVVIYLLMLLCVFINVVFYVICLCSFVTLFLYNCVCSVCGVWCFCLWFWFGCMLLVFICGWLVCVLFVSACCVKHFVCCCFVSCFWDVVCLFVVCVFAF